MCKKSIFYLFLFVGGLANAQVGGQSVYQFLNLVSSPRQAALGGKVITFYDEDVNQAQFNPATINEQMDNHLGVNYGSYFGDINYGTVSYAYTFDRHTQTFFVGTSFINYGKFDGYDEYGNQTGQFTANEGALSVGYAFNIPNSNVHIGANAKLITSGFEQYTSFGGAVDLGVLFVDEKNDVNWAFTIRNLGTQFTTYAGTHEKLPTEVMLGVSQLVENVPIRWHLTFENLQQWKIAFANPNRAVGSIDGSSEAERVSVINNFMRHVIIGAELFPEKGFNLRLGYNFRRGEELGLVDQRNFSGMSIGFGLKMRNLKFNYAYSRYTLAGNTSLFGVTMNFNENN
jgi:hypothetical protein